MKWEHLACQQAAVWGVDTVLGTTYMPGRMQKWGCRLETPLWSGAYLLLSSRLDDFKVFFLLFFFF